MLKDEKNLHVVSLEEHLDKEKYGPQSLIGDLQKVHKERGIELMAVVYKQKDGTVYTCTTHGNNAELVGLLELGKYMMLEDF